MLEDEGEFEPDSVEDCFHHLSEEAKCKYWEYIGYQARAEINSLEQKIQLLVGYPGQRYLARIFGRILIKNTLLFAGCSGKCRLTPDIQSSIVLNARYPVEHRLIPAIRTII